MRHIRALCQPKMSGIAPKCATGVRRMAMPPLSKYRVSVLPSHFDRALPLAISTERCILSFRLSDAFCHFDRALLLVISTERCLLSFRPSGSEWRNLRGAPPNRRTGGAILCAVPMVAVRQGPISACGAPR